MTQRAASQPLDRLNIVAQPVTVPGTGNTSIAEFGVSYFSRIAIEIAVATQNLDAFIIQARFHGSASYQTLYSAAGDFTSPAGLLVAASGDLTTITAGAQGWFILDTTAIESIKLLASAAADSAAVTVRGSGA